MIETKAPEGYMEDAQGRLVPLHLVDEYDRLKNDLVMETVQKALGLQEDMRRFKAEITGDIEALVKLAAEKYNAQIGGKKGNISLVSFDGRFKIQRAVAENLVFDERLQVAKGLVDECIKDWTEGSRQELQALINDAFQVDKEGRVNSARILSLRKLKIADDRWERAMQAIADSLQVAGTSTYFRVYRRDDAGKYQPVSLDLAAL